MARRRDQIGQSDEHNARGIELADRGWLDEAVREFKKSIELDPAAAHAHDNLATVLTEKGQLSEALVEYVEALRVDPASPTAHHYLASFLAGHGYDLAINLYRRALELEYDFPDAHLNLAMALEERGQLEDALAELQIAHGQAQDDEMIHHELACCLIDMERYPDAIGHLKRIVKAYPQHIEAFVDLGIAYTAQGFYAEAEAILTKGLEIDGHDFATHYHLAALYATWGRPAEALDHLEIAASHDHEKVRLWLKDDRLFDALRGHERYLKLMA
ncbi:MAG: tetratricopeptide repeat protein [Deltaproteobacteria bacterium]|nr:tetratricopeptide repeat protein [Deltaproteobacteria bacterium]